MIYKKELLLVLVCFVISSCNTTEYKQFKIDNKLIIKIKKLVEENNRDKLLSSLAYVHYADLAEIFELLEKCLSIHKKCLLRKFDGNIY